MEEQMLLLMLSHHLYKRRRKINSIFGAMALGRKPFDR
jgi:hypothetical protein